MRRIPTYPEPGLSRVLIVWAALAAIVMAVVGLASSPARAAPLTVTNNGDSGAGSLRQAMIDARATGSADTIGFVPSLAGQTIVLDSQLPLVTAAGGALTIDGGSANITVSGSDTGQVRLFEVGGAARLTLNKLTVTESNSGSILNNGTLEVSNSTISGNSNNVFGGGGGIYNASGVARMWNTTITGSRAPRTSAGGGIVNANGPATMWNSIVANNTTGGGPGNCVGETVTNGGNNLDSGATCGFGTANASLSNTNPMLGPLADNGGATETRALLSGSPATNKGNNAFAVDPEGNPLQFDQRGERFPRVVSPAVDMGAFEFQGKGVGSEPPPAKVPEDKQACRKGSFREFGFKNQGLCIKAVNAKN